jgi:hypothetical protein
MLLLVGVAVPIGLVATYIVLEIRYRIKCRRFERQLATLFAALDRERDAVLSDIVRQVRERKAAK